jgi:hypothetical protein
MESTDDPGDHFEITVLASVTDSNVNFTCCRIVPSHTDQGLLKVYRTYLRAFNTTQNWTAQLIRGTGGFIIATKWEEPSTFE